MESATTLLPDTALPSESKENNPSVDTFDVLLGEDLECVPDTDVFNTSQNEESTRRHASPNSPNETSVPNRAGVSPDVNDREKRKAEGKTGLGREQGKKDVEAGEGEEGKEEEMNVDDDSVNTHGQSNGDAENSTPQDGSEEESMLELLNRSTKLCTRAARRQEVGQSAEPKKAAEEKTKTSKSNSKTKPKAPKAEEQEEEPKLDEKSGKGEKEKKEPTKKRIRVRVRGKKERGEEEIAVGESKKRVRRKKGEVGAKENGHGEDVPVRVEDEEGAEEEGGSFDDVSGILDRLHGDNFGEFLERDGFGQQNGEGPFPIDLSDMAMLYAKVQNLRAQGLWMDEMDGASQEADDFPELKRGKEWQWEVVAAELPFCNGGVHAWALYTRYLLTFDRANEKITDALEFLEKEDAAGSQFLARVAAKPLTSTQIENWTLDKMLTGLSSSLPLSSTNALNALLIYTNENEIVLKTSPAVLSVVLNYIESIMIESGIPLVGDIYGRKRLCAVGACPNHDDCLLTSTSQTPTDRLFSHGPCPCHHLTLHIRSALIVLENLCNLPFNCVLMASSSKFITIISSLLDLPGVWRTHGLLEQVLEVASSAADWLQITCLEKDWPMAVVVVGKMVGNLIDLGFDCVQPGNENEKRVLELSLEVLSRLVFSEGFERVLGALRLQTRQRFVDLTEIQLSDTWCTASCYALLVASTLSEIPTFQDLLCIRVGLLRALVEVIFGSGRSIDDSMNTESGHGSPEIDLEHNITYTDMGSDSDGEDEEEEEKEESAAEEKQNPWAVRAVTILRNLGDSACRYGAWHIMGLEQELAMLAFGNGYETCTNRISPDTRAALCGLLARM